MKADLFAPDSFWLPVLTGLFTFFLGFWAAKQHYRKKYKQRHTNVLNCASFRPPANDRLFVFAVATHKTRELDRLVRSFTSVGNVSIEIIGLGCKWQGFGNKPLWLREKILQNKLEPQDLVLFVDAYDVVCQSDLCNIVGLFKSFNKQIVFGAERGCHPDPSLADQFPPSPTSMRFTNSGGFIGYAQEILRMVDQSGIQPHEDDQNMACVYSIKNPERVGLDYRAEIFLNLYSVDQTELETIGQSPTTLGKAYRWQETGRVPLILHGNGPAKEFLRAIAPLSEEP